MGTNPHPLSAVIIDFCEASTMTLWGSSIRTLILSQLLQSERMGPGTGSGLGASRISHFFKMSGSSSISTKSGLTKTLPGARGMNVESICMG